MKNKEIFNLAKYHILALFLMPVLVFGLFFSAIHSLKAEEATVTASANEALVSDLNKQIDEQREKIDALADKIDEHKASIKKYQNQAASLRNQVYILDNQVAKTQLDIEAKEKEVELTELEIEKVELEIEENESMIDSQKEYLAAFIRLLDYYDDRDYLSILLNNESFSEFFDQINRVEGIEADMQKGLNRFQELIEHYTDQKEELSEKRDKLSELLNKLDSEKYALGDQIETKKYLIAETGASEQKYQDLVDNLKQEQLIANNAIAGIERRLREELEKRGEGEKFNDFSDAALVWPTDSHRITAHFHDTDYPYRHLFEHSGTDIGVPVGTPLKAAEAGYVARVSVGTKWYGTYVMIIHNNNLATLYAHMSSASVSTDQYVSKGQIIGYSGNTGFSSGPHLHFEVRLNGIPVNPLNYLAN